MVWAGVVGTGVDGSRVRLCVRWFRCRWRAGWAAAAVCWGQARRKTRSRRWGAPTSLAWTLRHVVSYPVAARSASTRWSPPLRQRSAATFSTMSRRGRSRRRAATMSVQSPLRVPFSMPARLPAAEMSCRSNVSLGGPPSWWITTRRWVDSFPCCRLTVVESVVNELLVWCSTARRWVDSFPCCRREVDEVLSCRPPPCPADRCGLIGAWVRPLIEACPPAWPPCRP